MIVSIDVDFARVPNLLTKLTRDGVHICPTFLRFSPMVTETVLTGVFLAPKRGSRCHSSILRCKAGCLHGPRTKNDSEIYSVRAPAMRARKASHSSKYTSIDVYEPLRDTIVLNYLRCMYYARSSPSNVAANDRVE